MAGDGGDDGDGDDERDGVGGLLIAVIDCSLLVLLGSVKRKVNLRLLRKQKKEDYGLVLVPYGVRRKSLY